jgi:flavin reductase (DIM6/NTAB) family NADH-FMN oxidoreductase RutF
MKNVNPLALPESFWSRLEEGAFLTVKAGDSMNTMTIGWGMAGVAWRLPVFMVLVRDSRHTYSIMEKAVDFTVTVPTGDMKDALALCGTRSGRDLDKLEACGLRTRPGLHTTSPILDVPGLHLECRILYKTPMDPSRLDPPLGAIYPARDYHTLYFGEILGFYELEGR